jgi:hypothetical protein
VLRLSDKAAYYFPQRLRKLRIDKDYLVAVALATLSEPMRVRIQLDCVTTDHHCERRTRRVE